MFGVGSYAAIFGADAGSLVGLLWICLGILQSVGGHTRPLKIVQSGVILAYQALVVWAPVVESFFGAFSSANLGAGRWQ